MGLGALVEMSNRYGANEEFVICTGGNTSYKDGGVMYVKASGTELAAITADNFSVVELQKLRDITASDQSDEESFEMLREAVIPGYEHKRPSIETLLHALFPYKYVLHLHPTIVNGLTCSVDYEKVCARLFPKAACITVMSPGPSLARLCKKTIDDAGSGCPKIMFLQNHGSIVAADTVGEIDDLMTYIIDMLTGEIKEYPDMTDPNFADDVVKKYNIVSNPISVEQILCADGDEALINAAKIAVYAQSFGGINPLPEDIISTMLQFNPYA